MPEDATGKPWLPINRNYKEVNTASEKQIPRSTLDYYKYPVQLRKKDTFAYVSLTSTVLNGNVYSRELENNDTHWFLINLGAREARIGENVPRKTLSCRCQYQLILRERVSIATNRLSAFVHFSECKMCFLSVCIESGNEVHENKKGKID